MWKELAEQNLRYLLSSIFLYNPKVKESSETLNDVVRVLDYSRHWAALAVCELRRILAV
jgi:hypothetical protein